QIEKILPEGEVTLLDRDQLIQDHPQLTTRHITERLIKRQVEQLVEYQLSRKLWISGSRLVHHDFIAEPRTYSLNLYRLGQERIRKIQHRTLTRAGVLISFRRRSRLPRCAQHLLEENAYASQAQKRCRPSLIHG